VDSYFGYIRVSTAKQGEGVSLQEQKTAIERFAARNGLLIAEWFEEKETAAKRGRPVWTAMLRLLRKRKAAGVVIHKIDRSARNLKDWAELGEYIDDGVNVRFATEDLDLTSQSGRLSADIQAVLAAHYIRNLREEILKGFYGRLKQGVLPLPAPIGYHDEGAGKPKTIDPITGPLVRKAFELYASGRYNFHSLRDELERLGLRNRHGRPLSLSGLTSMLRNPFYIGIIRLKKRAETFQGAHETLIPKSLFDRVQAVLDGRLNTRTIRHVFPLRRMIRCASCGYSLIGEERRGYRYYRCHTRSCPKTILREKDLESTILEKFLALELAPEEVRYVEAKLGEMREGWANEAAREKEQVRRQIGELTARLGRLTDAFVDGALERELFEERKTSILFDRKGLEEKLAELERNPEAGLIRLQEYLGLAKSAAFQYEQRLPEERRELIETLTSDWTAHGRSFGFALRKPFSRISERFNSSNGGPHRDIPRIWDPLLKSLYEEYGDRPG
jgi:site-specific DNA recombinase